MFGQLKVLLALLGAVVVLAGCGGNVGGNPPAAAAGAGTTSITATAGSGAPAIGATVTMVCAGGTAGTAVTVSTTGTFTVTATGAAPCVIKLTGGNISTTTYPTGMFSIVATAAQTRANINQLTHFIASQLAQGDPDANLFKSSSSLTGKVTATLYAAAKKAIVDNVIANLGGAVGISTSFDPVEDSYTADGSKFDKLLDNVGLSGTTTIIITFKPTGATLVSIVLSSGTVTAGTTGVIGAGSLADLGGLQSFEDSLRTNVFAVTAGFADLTAASNALSSFLGTGSNSVIFATPLAAKGLFSASGTAGAVVVNSAFAAFASRTSQAPTFTSVVGSISNGLGQMLVALNFSDTAGTNSNLAGRVERVTSGTASSAWRLNQITSP